MARIRAVDNPLCTEIRDVCVSQNLGVEFETNKHYPREAAKDHIHSGRVRVQIKGDDGSPLNENITTRKSEMPVVQASGVWSCWRQIGRAGDFVPTYFQPALSFLSSISRPQHH